MTVVETSTHSYHLFIGGNWIPSDTGAISNDYNPTTGQVYARVAEASAADAAKAVEAAHEARIEWAKKPGRERARFLLRAADILEANAVEYANRKNHCEQGRRSPEARRTGAGGQGPYYCAGRC